MTNQPVCFVCGVAGAGSVLHTKPQSKGAYFTFLTNHSPPSGAKLPDCDGLVSCCIICKAFLTEQWKSYERQKTPLVERLFWMKRIDDQAFTGAEMNVQGEYVAQFIGANSGFPCSTDELPEQTYNKFKRKTTDASSPGLHNDSDDTYSSCEDFRHYDNSSGVLDLSTSPRKFTLASKSSGKGCLKTSSNGQIRNSQTTEKKTRSRQSSGHSLYKFVCYICKGQFCSPQKLRFLSCIYSTDDEPYFPFVRSLVRPEGAKEITKSGLIEVCCDCRKALSRQWRVFETRKVSVENRKYDFESLVNKKGVSVNPPEYSFSSNSENLFTRNSCSAVVSDVKKIDVSQCFFCSQLATVDTLQRINDTAANFIQTFESSSSQHLLNLLPLSKKLVELKTFDQTQEVACCSKCLQLFLLEKQVLEKGLGLPNRVHANGASLAKTDSYSNENGLTFSKSESAMHSTELIGSLFQRLLKNNNFHKLLEYSSRTYPNKNGTSLDESNKKLSSKRKSCYLCQNILKDGELICSGEKTVLILNLLNSMNDSRGLSPSAASLNKPSINQNVHFCHSCFEYLICSVVSQNIPRTFDKKEILNGFSDLSRTPACFYCLKKQSCNNGSYISLKCTDAKKADVRSEKFENLLKLGLKEIVVCESCNPARDTARGQKRKMSLPEANSRESKKLKKRESYDDVADQPYEQTKEEIEERENESSCKKEECDKRDDFCFENDEALDDKNDDDEGDDDDDVVKFKSEPADSRRCTSPAEDGNDKEQEEEESAADVIHLKRKISKHPLDKTNQSSPNISTQIQGLPADLIGALPDHRHHHHHHHLNRCDVSKSITVQSKTAISGSVIASSSLHHHPLLTSFLLSTTSSSSPQIPSSQSTTTTTPHLLLSSSHDSVPNSSSAPQFKTSFTSKPFSPFIPNHFTSSFYLPRYQTVNQHHYHHTMSKHHSEWNDLDKMSWNQMPPPEVIPSASTSTPSSHLSSYLSQCARVPYTCGTSCITDKRSPTDGVKVTTLYRPFSEDEACGKDNTSDFSHKRSIDVSQGSPIEFQVLQEQDSCSNDTKKLHQTPLRPETAKQSGLLTFTITTTNGCSDDAKDERLTAALGLISLRSSEVSMSDTFQTSVSPSPLQRNSNDNAAYVQPNDRKASSISISPIISNIPTIDYSITSSLLSSENNLNSSSFEWQKVVNAKKGCSADSADTREMKLDAKSTFTWPGVAAIIDSYNKHHLEQLSEKNCLKSLQDALSCQQLKLRASIVELEATLKQHQKQWKLVEEEGGELRNKINTLKSFLNL